VGLGGVDIEGRLNQEEYRPAGVIGGSCLCLQVTEQFTVCVCVCVCVCLSGRLCECHGCCVDGEGRNADLPLDFLPGLLLIGGILDVKQGVIDPWEGLACVFVMTAGSEDQMPAKQTKAFTFT